jgi:hypothetical protein
MIVEAHKLRRREMKPLRRMMPILLSTSSIYSMNHLKSKLMLKRESRSKFSEPSSLSSRKTSTLISTS